MKSVNQFSRNFRAKVSVTGNTSLPLSKVNIILWSLLQTVYYSNYWENVHHLSFTKRIVGLITAEVNIHGASTLVWFKIVRMDCYFLNWIPSFFDLTNMADYIPFLIFFMEYLGYSYPVRSISPRSAISVCYKKFSGKFDYKKTKLLFILINIRESLLYPRLN